MDQHNYTYIDICPYCGHQNRGGAKFCSRCGAANPLATEPNNFNSNPPPQNDISGAYYQPPVANHHVTRKEFIEKYAPPSIKKRDYDYFYNLLCYCGNKCALKLFCSFNES